MADLHNKDIAKAFYDKRYEEGYMEEWDDLKKSKVREVISQLNLPESGKALDFGCGNGVFTHIIKELLPKWEVYGVEISQIALHNASRKFKDCIFFGFEEAANYSNQFDFLFSHHVMEHVQDIKETFTNINSYLKPYSSQLHILPCGNKGSYEYNICMLHKNGIDLEKGNRFFFEEPGHLRRLTTDEFKTHEEAFGFELKKEFYSNQHSGAVNWITKSSPRFVKKLTDPANALNTPAFKKLKKLRRKLLPLTYLQFPYSKFMEVKSKWHKKPMDYLKLLVLFFPAMVARPYFQLLQKKALTEWQFHNTEKSGSEMFLYFTRQTSI